MDKNRLLDELMAKHPLLAEAVRNHPLGDLRRDYPGEEISAIQAAMSKDAQHFSALELQALHVVIRLTVVFYHYLQRVDIESVDLDSLLYIDGSIFSGVDSFCSLRQAYGTTAGESTSSLPQRVESLVALKEAFTTMYREFVMETNFERKCRVLLDMFKLQIVFAGLTYD